MNHATPLLLFLLCGQPSEAAEDPVATLRWGPTTQDVFVRGTVPVPDSVDPTSSDWTLNHPLRAPIPAQVEAVVRGPNGDVEVIEVIARVDRGEQPIRWAKLTPALQLTDVELMPPPHEQLPAPMRIRAKDAAGALYEAVLKPGARGHIQHQPRKRGHVHRQDMHALVMLPRPNEESIHPHLFGVHAYLGNWTGSSFLTLDLRIHNGLIGPSTSRAGTEAPVGPLYFESIQLVVPEDWAVSTDVADPAMGSGEAKSGETVFDLIAPMAGDKLHVLPPGARFHRRLAIHPAAQAAAKRAKIHLSGSGRAVCLPAEQQWSWSNPETARYFPQRQLLPDINAVKAPSAGSASSLLDRLRLADGALAVRIRQGSEGKGLFSSAMLGWAHPWFRPTAGGHGGEGITFLEGIRALASADRDEFRSLELLHQVNASRHPTGSWRANGTSTSLEEWLNEDGALPFSYHLVAKAALRPLRLPCDGGPELAPAIAAVVDSDRRPPYDASTAWSRDGKRPSATTDILAWHPHDGAHIIRFTAHAKALAWLCNDSLAIDAIVHEAERVRLALPDCPSTAPALTTLHQLREFADTRPGHGLPIGRELGWALDTTAAAFALGDASTRARLRPWIVSACRIIARGTPPTGVSIRNDHSPLSVPRTHATAHSFQTAILQLGLRSASRSCLRGVEPALDRELDAIFLSCIETLFHGPVFHPGPLPRTVWPKGGDPSGPRWIFPVAPLDWSEPPLPPGSLLPASGFDGGVEVHYAYTMLAWAHALDPPGPGEPFRHRSRLLDLGPRYASLEDLIEHLARRSRVKPGLDPLSQVLPALLYTP